MAPNGKPGSATSTAPDHDALVQRLAELPESERRRVVAAAAASAGAARPVLAWSSWRASRGVVSLGGDAVADCDRLYDGS